MAHHWRVDAWGNHDGAAGDLLGAFLYGALGMEFTDMTQELKEMLKARDMLDAQPVPELSPESLYNIMEAMGFASRPWVGLTDEEISNLWSCSMTCEAELTATTQQHAFAQAIEAKLKEKNA